MNQYYDHETKTLVILGTHNPLDVATDILAVPEGRIRQTKRYKEALRTYNNLISEGSPVNNIVAHSLGGLVSNELNNEVNFKGNVRIYDSPLVTGVSHIRRNVQHVSQYADPVSSLDFTSKRVPFDFSNIHRSYKE